MYGIKQLQFDATDPDPACDVCSNKHLNLFSLGEYCKVYDNKTCCFSELAKENIQLCKDCISTLRKTKVFQSRCWNAQKNLEAQLTIIYDYSGRTLQRTLQQLLHAAPGPAHPPVPDPARFRALIAAELLNTC